MDASASSLEAARGRAVSFRRRRRRAQAVSYGTSRVPAINAADSIAANYQTGGATFPSLPEHLVPPGGVRRLFEFDDQRSDSLIIRSVGGKGGGPAPFDRPRRSPIVSVVVGPARRQTPFTPLQAHRARASWREFRKLRFPQPGREPVCVRRLRRKQVLFARGIAGRSGGSPGPYRRNAFSSWSC